MYSENIFDSDATKRITIEVDFLLNLEERKELVKRIHPIISTVDYENYPIFNQLKRYYFMLSLSGFKEGRCNAIVTSKVLDEGVDVQAAELTVNFMGPVKCIIGAGR